MTITEVDVLDNEILETETLQQFECEFPKERPADAKRAEKMAANNIAINNLLEGIDVDDVMVLGAKKLNVDLDKFDFLPKKAGIGLTAGLDFYNLDKENPDWINERINLATDDDFLFSKFFVEGEQNEVLRQHRKNKNDDSDDDDDN